MNKLTEYLTSIKRDLDVDFVVNGIVGIGIVAYVFVAFPTLAVCVSCVAILIGVSLICGG